MPETQADSDRTESAPGPGGDILSRIVQSKREEIAALGGRVGELRSRAGDQAAARGFRAALSDSDSVSLVAEVKRRSPGAGPIRPDLEPVELAQAYAEAGASAISVLTDGPYFGGSLDDLSAVRAAVRVPVLRKDFMVSDVQVWEARAAGADAVLLIVRILDDGPLKDLRLLAEDLGMGVLVEAHDRHELERAVESGAGIVGINNRDLSTFRTRLETTIDLMPDVPATVTCVSESGIGERAEVERLAGAGVAAILVGESLLRVPEPRDKVRELVGVPKNPGGGAGPDGA